MLDTVRIPATPAGTAGSASADVFTPTRIDGKLIGIHVDYTSQPATTDVTVKTKGGGTPSITFLTLTNVNTDGWYYPRAALCDAAGAALLYAAGGTPQTDNFYFGDIIEVVVAQGDPAANGVVVTILFDNLCDD